MEDKQVGTIISRCALYINSRTDNDSSRTLNESLFLLVGKEVAQCEDNEEQQTYEETYLTQPYEVTEKICQGKLF